MNTWEIKTWAMKISYSFITDHSQRVSWNLQTVKNRHGALEIDLPMVNEPKWEKKIYFLEVKGILTRHPSVQPKISACDISIEHSGGRRVKRTHQKICLVELLETYWTEGNPSEVEVNYLDICSVTLASTCRVTHSNTCWNLIALST